VPSARKEPLVQRAGKQPTGAKRGRAFSRTEFDSASDWLKKKAFPDWLQSVARRTFLEPIIIENVRNAISLDTSKITVRPVLVTSTNPTR